ncbi:hypothetical protein AMECASPLE_018084 [Ameca splendens]|uniref:Secreted protein n=1 Tax=Ameca splendens TaxID=208324 RepID=A0ABV0ZQ56_9TELE
MGSLGLQKTIQSTSLFLFALAFAVPPSELMGLCSLARLLLLGSGLNEKKTETHTHTHTHSQPGTHRMVLLATLTFPGKACLFQFYNEMGSFEAVPPIHQTGY